jgi:hypothetical protein
LHGYKYCAHWDLLCYAWELHGVLNMSIMSYDISKLGASVSVILFVLSQTSVLQTSNYTSDCGWSFLCMFMCIYIYVCVSLKFLT